MGNVSISIIDGLDMSFSRDSTIQMLSVTAIEQITACRYRTTTLSSGILSTSNIQLGFSRYIRTGTYNLSFEGLLVLDIFNILLTLMPCEATEH